MSNYLFIYFWSRKTCLSRQNTLLSQQKYACRDETNFVGTNMCLSRQNFCLDKHTFVATKDVFCRDKHVFVATKVCLSRQTSFCRDKYFRDKSFGPRKKEKILVVAPASDSNPPPLPSRPLKPHLLDNPAPSCCNMAELRRHRLWDGGGT